MLRVVARVAFGSLLLLAAGAACSAVLGFEELRSGPASDDAGNGALGDGADVADVTVPDALADGAPDVVAALLGCGAADAGLAAYFRLDETRGYKAFDCSGNGLEGVLSDGGGWTPDGAVGGALTLDDSFVSLGTPLPLRLDGAFTVAAFVWMGVLGPLERPAVVSKMGYDGGRGWELAIRTAAEARVARFTVSPDNVREEDVTSSTPLAPGEWIHLAGTYDAGTLRIYVNGSLANERLDASPTVKDPVNVQAVIGGRPYDYHWKGRIDEVRIYSRALDPGEIAILAKR